MATSNFTFLHPYQQKLYEYGASAEGYVYSDPQSAMVKLRCFAEQFVGYIYQELRLPTNGAKDFFEKLDNAAFKSVVEPCVLDKLHLIRLKGNKAVHAGVASSADALILVKEAFFLGAWVFVAHHDGAVEDLPGYQAPHDDEPMSIAGAEVVAADQFAAHQMELKELQDQLERAQQRIDELVSEVDEPKLQSFRERGVEAVASYDFEVDKTRENIRIEDIFSQYDLTDGQAELVTRLDSFLTGTSTNVFLLKGYAGTGKTFLTKGLTEYFRAIRRNYVLAAPTGKAAKVIANKTRSPAHTIHKAIYSFKDLEEFKEDDVDGSETYKFYAKLAVNEQSVDTVYIVDESSMISDIYNEAEFFRFGSGFLLRDFLKFVNLDHNDHRKKVILIGDDAQLPPVGMNFSPALDERYLEKKYGLNTEKFELTEVVRQKADSGVMHNAVMIRGALKAALINQLEIDTGYPDVLEITPETLLSEYLDSCGGKINAESIVIAHSNADVAAYNRRIREHFFPGFEAVTAGDKVMAISNSNANGIFISNGDFGLVRQVLGEAEDRVVTLKRKSKESGIVENTEVSLCFRDVEIGFRDIEGTPHWFKAKIVENLLYSDAPTLSSDENKALYLDFCIRHPHLKRKSLEFKEELQSDPYFNALRLKFGYAITCHKAQGSEWNNVFVKCNTSQNPLSIDYFRWLYTAITRTSSKIFLLSPPRLTPWGDIKISKSPGIPVQKNTRQKNVTSPQENILVDNRESNGNSELIGNSENGRLPTFGIPESATFLRAILNGVRSLLLEHPASIFDIIHNQYQEAYIFAYGEDSIRINFSYDSKENIKGISSTQVSERGAELVSLLSALKGQKISIDAKESINEVQFSEPFLNAFHAQLIAQIDAQGISVKNVIEHPWSLRYTFARDEEFAVYDIYYNGKKRITRCAPVVSECSPGPLRSEVETIFTEGMSS